MIRLTQDTRLTDELERELMAQAIEEQFRFRPLKALTQLLSKLKAKAPQAQASVSGQVRSAH